MIRRKAIRIEIERIFRQTIWDFCSDFQINTQDKVIVLLSITAVESQNADDRRKGFKKHLDVEFMQMKHRTGMALSYLNMAGREDVKLNIFFFLDNQGPFILQKQNNPLLEKVLSEICVRFSTIMSVQFDRRSFGRRFELCDDINE